MEIRTFGTTKKNTFVSIVLAVVLWTLHRYNKTNKLLNVWERSEKDKAAFGVTNEARCYVSRDGRLQVRWNIWSIYILKPWTIGRK